MKLSLLSDLLVGLAQPEHDRGLGHKVRLNFLITYILRKLNFESYKIC